jgi:hypothetical protein
VVSDVAPKDELPEYLASPDAVIGLLDTTLVGFAGGGSQVVSEPPEAVKPPLDRLLERPSAIRDGILILLAYAVSSEVPLDFRRLPKFPGARRVAQHLADSLLPNLHIAGRKDALQTVSKGVATYYGVKNQTWREILGWASDQDAVEPISQAFGYLASGVAATARDLPPMPALDTPLLTFARVFGVLDRMLPEHSGGAHQQFVFAALLESHVNQLGLQGHVTTKNINASDASAGTAADVQLKRGGQVLEAYEVTAAGWQSKLSQARAALSAYDLRRIHVLGANVTEMSGDHLAAALTDKPDIVVLELREEIRSLVARLDKPHRREALIRLYDHLVAKQPDDALVRSYVTILHERGLTERR